MNVISVFGYKHSGKTTVALLLLQQLAHLGTVGYEKRTHSEIKLDMHLRTAAFTKWSAVVDQQGFAIVATQERLNLPQVDFLVVEGYVPDAPNILCVRGQEEMKRATPKTIAIASISGVPGTLTPEEAVELTLRFVNPKS
ncbi:molybdopterin-guanine dinucleotide biosynthesis protein B [Coprothermobacteraceae bacterium]|nr:molybdopterin-guanine dinucleotide biosynthesis protein B [Coprothermobacteraceae bacterium]